MAPPVELSIVIPVWNEAPVLRELHVRLSRVCAATGLGWEIVFVDDGSGDGSAEVLNEIAAGDTAVRVIRFARNFGQQAAVLAGFRYSLGGIVVQLDADPQHPPEEIPKLLTALARGFDLVTTVPRQRRDRWWRIAGSRLVRGLGAVLIGPSCRLNLGSFRAMRRTVIDQLVSAHDRRYLAVLASTLAVPSTEIEVEHHPRARGETKYTFFGLLKLAGLLVAGYSRAAWIRKLAHRWGMPPAGPVRYTVERVIN